MSASVEQVTGFEPCGAALVSSPQAGRMTVKCALSEPAACGGAFDSVGDVTYLGAGDVTRLCGGDLNRNGGGDVTLGADGATLVVVCGGGGDVIRSTGCDTLVGGGETILSAKSGSLVGGGETILSTKGGSLVDGGGAILSIVIAADFDGGGDASRSTLVAPDLMG